MTTIAGCARHTARAIAVLLAAGLAGPARPALEPAHDRAFGGVFSNACGNQAMPMLRLYGDVMDVVQGGKTVNGNKLRLVKNHLGASPPADFKAAYTADVRGGDTLTFVMFHNAAGLFAIVEAGPKTLALIGPNVAGQRIRHCDPNRNALPGTKPPVELGPPEMLRDAAFRGAYVKALGPLARTAWLTKLDGPAQPVKTVKAAGAAYQLVTACKPHDCYDHSIVVLYAAASRTVFGKVHQAGRSTLLGNPPPAVATELERLWLAQYRQKN